MPNTRAVATLNGPPCPKCGQIHTVCVGHSQRTGKPCRKPTRKGQHSCRLHGGDSPGAIIKGQERVQLEEAHATVAKLGARRDIHPAEALIELVQFTAGEVDYWRSVVTQLEHADLIWGVTKVKEGGDDRGTTREAKPHIAYVMLRDSSDRLAAYAAAALKAGVDERRVRLAESQGQLLVTVIRQVLDGLHLTEEQQGLVPTVVPAALRLISGEVTG